MAAAASLERIRELRIGQHRRVGEGVEECLQCVLLPLRQVEAACSRWFAVRSSPDRLADILMPLS